MTLVQYLTGRGHTSRVECSRALGVTVRIIREMRAECNGRVLPTSAGYVLVEEASPEERRDAYYRTLRQATSTLKQANEIMKAINEQEVRDGRRAYTPSLPNFDVTTVVNPGGHDAR